MEAKYKTVVVASFVVLVTLAWKALNWVWFRPKRVESCLRKQGLNGNSYKFLVGDLKEGSRIRKEAKENHMPPAFSNDNFSRVLPLQHRHLLKYGKNCFTWMGPIPWLNITDPDLIKEAFMRMNEFQKPKVNHFVELLAPGLVSLEGEKWTKHRKLMSPAFHVEKLKLMLPTFQTSIIQMIKQWENLIPQDGSLEVDVFPYFSSLTGDVICRAAFGSSYEEGRFIFELLVEQKKLVLSGGLSLAAFIPGWKHMPTKINRKMKEIDAEMHTLLKGIINKRKKAMEVGEAPKDDLLGVLIESNFAEAKSRMSFRDMIDECKLFFLAGQETTSTLLTWAMILLAKHQDWQVQAREEVLATYGKKEPEYDGLSHLKIVTMILYEVLRLYPPVITTSRKVVNHEEKLGNLILPRGVVVNLLMFHAHLDPKIWGQDAKEFNPERFFHGVAKATGGIASFFPFGWGPRICIGQNFALVEAKLALSMILQKFSFELAPSYIHAPERVIAVQPEFGAQVILHQV